MNIYLFILSYLLFTTQVFSQKSDYTNFKLSKNIPTFTLEQTSGISKNDNILSNTGSPFNINDNPQIDSVIIKMTDSDIDTIKYFYTYDSLGNVASETKTNNFRLFFNYDSLGNEISFIWEIWKNDQWENFGLAFREYDQLGNQISSLFQLWKDRNWINESQSTYFYNSYGYLNTFITEDWDGTDWVNSLNQHTLMTLIIN